MEGAFAEACEKSALMKQLRYKAVEQETLSFADLEFRFAGRSPRRSGWRDGAWEISTDEMHMARNNPRHFFCAAGRVKSGFATASTG